MLLSSSLFQDTIQYLERHEETLRIKKLIFCLCKKYWENDLNVLSSFPLEDLIGELIETKPNIDQLTFSLYKLVKTLNRPKVYAGVAKIILDRLSSLYNDLEINEDSDVLSLATEPEATQTSDLELLLNQVIANLANHQEEERIKKLVFAVCKNRWENNINLINKHGLKNLIIEIYQQYPTPGDLEIAFSKVVENINKKTLYIAIAHIIINQLENVYDNLQEHLEETPVPETSTQIYDTQIVQVNNSYKAPLQRADLETSILDLNVEPIVTELKALQTVISETTSAKTYDIFEIRQEIMQYTNPLRAKILLFSLVFHPWDRSGQDWSMLRSYTLDDLLEQLIQSGRPVSDLESKLYATAKALTAPDVNLQAASTIIEAIKPFI